MEGSILVFWISKKTPFMFFYKSGMSSCNITSSKAGNIRRSTGFPMVAILALVVVLGIASARMDAAAPVILAQPQSVTCVEGDGVNPFYESLYPQSSIKFSVSVENGTTCTFQWQKDGVDVVQPSGLQVSSVYSPHIGNTDTDTMFITDCGKDDAGQYRVRVKNADGEVFSNAVTLTVLTHPNPRVMFHPAGATAAEGDAAHPSASLSVSVENQGRGYAPSNDSLTFLWQKDGVDLDASNYRTMASSDESIIKKNTLTIDPLIVADSGTYRAKITNRWGGVSYSNPAVLTVSGPQSKPMISGDPADVTIETNYTGGDSTRQVTFAVTASGATRYKWQKEGADLQSSPHYVREFLSSQEKSDCTAGAALTIKGIRDSDAGKYRVRVWNSAGEVVSREATLTVTHPQTAVSGTQAVVTGKSVAFSSNVSVTGTNAAIQWQVSTNGGATWSNVSNADNYQGATTTTLTVLNVASTMNGYTYRAKSTPVSGGNTQYGTPIVLSVAPQVFPHPEALAFDNNGNLYVTDDTLNVIRKIDLSTGRAENFAGGEGLAGSVDGTGTNARFNQPRGITFDGAQFYLADSGNALVRSITLSGEVSTLAGNATARGGVDGGRSTATLTAPEGIATFGSNYVVIADKNAHTIRTVDVTGTVSTLAGLTGVPGGADGTTWDAASIYNSGSNIYDLKQPGTARFNHPAAICSVVNPLVHTRAFYSLYIADSFNHTIRYINDNLSMQRTVITIAGLDGVSGVDDGNGIEARFNQPGGIAFSGYYIYIADTGNSTIRVITPYEEVVTIAGLPGVTGLRDGLGHEAMFNHPTGLALYNGKLYIADTGNAAIRELDLASGRVTTLSILPTATATGTSGTNPNNAGNPATQPSGSSGGGGGAASVWYIMIASIALLARALMPNKKI